MFRRIWQRIVQFFRRLVGWDRSSRNSRIGRRKQTYSPTTGTQKQPQAPKPLENSDREFLFMQLLEGVGHGWQQHRVLKFLAQLEGRTTEEEWVTWLRRFGERLLLSPAPNDELAMGMLQLGATGCGQLGEVATEIGSQLLQKGNKRQSVQPIQTAVDFSDVAPVQGDYEMAIEPEPIGLDRLWEMLQQDAGLAEQMAEMLQVQSTDPQRIIDALINQSIDGDRGILNENETPVSHPSEIIEAEFNLDGGGSQANLNPNKTPVSHPPEIIEAEFNLDGGGSQANLNFNNTENILTELPPENPTQASVDEAIVWFNQGVRQYGAGNLELAITCWEKALEIQPDDYESWYNRGNALTDLGRYEEAIASYERASEIQPEECEIWCNQGNAYLKLNLYEEAIYCYDRALEINSNLWQAWYNRGNAAAISDSYDPVLAFSSFLAQSNPQLNQRGYQGQLASYQEGLKYIRPDTQPEGWGILHREIAHALYNKGCIDSKPRQYWRKAVSEYRQALQTLTKETFPDRHLEILQELFKVHLGLGDIAEAQELHRSGSDLLQRFLNHPNFSNSQRKQIGFKFVRFNQLTVDLAVQVEQVGQALEIAEINKNTCFNWFLGRGNDEIISPNLRQIKQLIDPNTAIVYWHLSPSALTTFIIKQDTPEPIVLKESVVPEETKFPLRIVELENWVKEWNREYQEYSLSKDKKNHSWLREMEARLTHLGNIIDISEVIAELADIDRLILIPHRDLHRFPLHYLFPDNLAIGYLPSAQIGLSLQGSTLTIPKFLNIEYPDKEGLPELLFAEIESAAITQIFNNPTCLIDENATKENVISVLSDEYNIFNFLGHGYYNYTAPNKSALYLADKDKLTLEDISQLSLKNYHLAYLCACETAVPDRHSIAAEYLGLPSVFLKQGVSFVISTLWTVPEVSSALLAIEFYRRLKAQISPAIALKQSQQWLRSITYSQLAQWYQDLSSQLSKTDPGISEYLRVEAMSLQGNPDLINSSQPPYAHPYYWAGFTISGK